MTALRKFDGALTSHAEQGVNASFIRLDRDDIVRRPKRPDRSSRGSKASSDALQTRTVMTAVEELHETVAAMRWPSCVLASAGALP